VLVLESGYLIDYSDMSLSVSFKVSLHDRL